MKRTIAVVTSLLLLTLALGGAVTETAKAQADATSGATQGAQQAPQQGTQQAPQQGTQQAPRQGAQQAQGGTRDNGLINGTITAIGDSSITITLSRGSLPPANGNAPQGDQNNDGPSGQGAAPPQRDDGQAPGGADQSLTIAVTAATTITNEYNQAILLSDLTVGMNVTVQLSADTTTGYTATSISIAVVAKSGKTEANAGKTEANVGETEDDEGESEAEDD